MRAIEVLPARARGDRPVADTLLLTHDQRSSPRGELVGLRGVAVELALDGALSLRTDDCLVLEDGRLIEIVAKPEPLLDVRADNPSALARLAWLLGDQHIAVEVSARRLRVRRAAATETLLRAQGAKIVAIDAPFEPEGGAYAASVHAHAHGHHRHGHDHEHGG